jgi:hypothetical protein
MKARFNSAVFTVAFAISGSLKFPAPINAELDSVAKKLDLRREGSGHAFMTIVSPRIGESVQISSDKEGDPWKASIESDCAILDWWNPDMSANIDAMNGACEGSVERGMKTLENFIKAKPEDRRGMVLVHAFLLPPKK